MSTMKEQIMSIVGAVFRRGPVMITCEELDNFICDYLDQRLPADQLKIFEHHLELCEVCRDYLDEYRNTIELERRLLSSPEAAPPDEVPEDLVQAVLAARRGDKEP